MYQLTFTHGNQQRRMETLMSRAVSDSRRQGHRPGLPSPDVEGYATFTHCRDCGRAICVDLAESDSPYGSGITEPCTRRKGRRY